MTEPTIQYAKRDGEAAKDGMRHEPQSNRSRGSHWLTKVAVGVALAFALTFLAGVIVVLLAIIFVAHPNLGTAMRYEEDADKLLRAGREDEAAETYMKAAGTYADVGDFGGAVEAYSSVLRLRPEEAGAYNGRGYAYLNLTRYDRAEADFSRAIALDQEFVTAYANRGLARAMLGDSAGAIADFDKELSLSTDPDYDAGWLIDELEEAESLNSDSDAKAAIQAIIKHLKDGLSHTGSPQPP